MDILNKLPVDKRNECDALAISIIDRIGDKMNEDFKNSNEAELLGTICFIMGIGLKDIMKEELLKNPKNFLKKDTEIPSDIISDINKLIKYCN